MPAGILMGSGFAGPAGRERSSRRSRRMPLYEQPTKGFESYSVEQAIKIIAGAVCGGLVGFLMSRVRACSSRACKARIHPIYSVVGWAVFGAAVAWYLVRRGS
jgi:hypothetical protein